MSITDVNITLCDFVTFHVSFLFPISTAMYTNYWIYSCISARENSAATDIYKLTCRKYKIEVCTSFPTLRIFHRPVLLWSIADCDVYICKFNLIFYNLKMYANKPIRVCVLPDSSIRSICSLIFFRSGRGYFNMNNFT